MNEQLKRLVRDNPNLSANKIARLSGVNKMTVIRMRKRLGVKTRWAHKGCGIPFLYFSKVNIYHLVKYGKTVIHQGSFSGAMDNIDRLIFCLDNNNGKLPLTRREFYFKDLEF